MATTVRQVFRAAGLEPEGVVRWGVVPLVDDPGVYVVALAASPASLHDARAAAPLDRAAIGRWLERLLGLTLDGDRPSAAALADRVAGFWLAGEVVLYIGKATSLSSRVADYYATPLGARRPHAGGYFLKLLQNLRDLHVHFARCDDPGRAEDEMLAVFCGGVSAPTLASLLDPAHPFPFANLEWPAGTRKAHGIGRGREPRAPPPEPPGRHPQATGRPSYPAPSSRQAGGAGAYRSQRVTEADLRAG